MRRSLGAAVAAAALAWAGAAAAAPAAPFGLVCHLTERMRETCDAKGCTESDRRPFDETHSYVVDPSARRIVEYGPQGPLAEQPFTRPVSTDGGMLHALSGGDPGMGVNELPSLSIDLDRRTARLNALVLPGGEFSATASNFNAAGDCTFHPVADVAARP